MQAYIVRLNDVTKQRPGRGIQTMVNALSETEAKARGASALNVLPSQVTAVAYGGPTLGELAR